MQTRNLCGLPLGNPYLQAKSNEPSGGFLVVADRALSLRRLMHCKGQWEDG